MPILSIQSRVTSGYVGNAAATPVLQRLGRTVWPIDTVVFSNHPAHGRYRGGVRPAAEIEALVAGLDARGLLAGCAAVLSGYLGAVAAGPAIRDAAVLVRAANPKAVWCCDPVMGDDGEFYVGDDIAAFFRDQAVPAADIVTPNVFEAGFLSGTTIVTPDDAIGAARRLLAMGPRIVVITGLRSGASIACVAATADGVWRVDAPVLDVAAQGAGDTFTALFLGQFLESGDVATALSRAASGVHAVLAATARTGADELALIAALDAAVRPPRMFPARLLPA
jgi:pyridoxine kinase